MQNVIFINDYEFWNTKELFSVNILINKFPTTKPETWKKQKSQVFSRKI